MLGFSPLGGAPLGDQGAATVTVPSNPATAVITAVTFDGQDVTVSGTTTNVPTSGMGSITADATTPAGAVTQGPVALTLGSGTFSVTFTGVPTGSYSGQVITVTNGSGTVQASGSTAFAIDGIGEPATPTGDTTLPVMGGALIAGTSTAFTIPLSGWTATDNVGVAGFEYSTGGAYTNIGMATSITAGAVVPLFPATSYTLSVRAYDAAGNRSVPLTTSATTAALIVALRACVNVGGIMTPASDAQVGAGLKPLVFINNRVRQRQNTEGMPIVSVNGRFRLLRSGETLEI
jgi:hypothetical protein